jgi:hypothetical protein
VAPPHTLAGMGAPPRRIKQSSWIPAFSAG